MDTDLNPQQEAEAQRIYQALKQAADADLMALARLLASKPDSQLLGTTEFQVRDAVHTIGAKALETALQGRKKGATTAPAVPAPPASRRLNSTATKPAASTAPLAGFAGNAPTTIARTATPAIAPGTASCA